MQIQSHLIRQIRHSFALKWTQCIIFAWHFTCDQYWEFKKRQSHIIHYKSSEFDQIRPNRYHFPTAIVFKGYAIRRSPKHMHTDKRHSNIYSHHFNVLEFHTISGEITVRCTEIFSKKKLECRRTRLMRKLKERAMQIFFSPFHFFQSHWK